MIIKIEDIPDKFRRIMLFDAMRTTDTITPPITRQRTDEIFDDIWYVYDFPYRLYLKNNKLKEYYSLLNWYSYCHTECIKY